MTPDPFRSIANADDAEHQDSETRDAQQDAQGAPRGQGGQPPGVVRPVLAAALGAALYVTAVTIHGAFAWLVHAPLVRLCHTTQRSRSTVLAAAVFGLVVAVGFVAPWAAAALARHFDLPTRVALAGVLTVAVVWGAGFGILLGVLFRGASSPRWTEILTIPAAAVAWEWAIRSFPPGYPWVGLAAPQAELPRVSWLAAELGAPGLTFLAVLASVLVVRTVEARRPVRGALLVALLALAVLARGQAGLSGNGADAAAGRCRLAGVDLRLGRGDLPPQELLEGYLRRSESVVNPGLDALIWPESALNVPPDRRPALLAELRSFSARYGMPLLFGAPRLVYGGDWKERTYNSVYRLDGDDPLRWYDKQVPVPFVERWPLDSIPPPPWFGTSLASGGESTTFDVGGCRVGVLICFEESQPGLARRLALENVDAIVVVSNDAALPKRLVDMELDQARLRARETGRPLFRVANRGVSAAIDPEGRIQEQRRGGTISAQLAAAHPTRAQHLARWFEGACVALSGFSLVAFFRCRREG